MAPESGYFDLIIIGAGPIGMHIARRVDRQMSVLVIDADCASPDTTENRSGLLRLLALGTDALTAQHSPACPPNIMLRTATRVAAIERSARVVVTAGRERISYSRLVLATGASPRRPDLGVSVQAPVQIAYRQADIERIARAAAAHQSILIIGGGLLAVELAAGIAKRARVTLTARGRLLRSYADPDTAERVARHLRRLGVDARTGCSIASIDCEGRQAIVSDSQGARFHADRVVFACGMQPNVGLANAAGLDVDNGIAVDASMRTNDERIFAVGDCARPDRTLARGSVANGIRQAERVVAELAGEERTRARADGLLTREIDLCGLRFVSAGCAPPSEPDRPGLVIRRRLGRRALSIGLRDRHITRCQALLPNAPAARLVQLAQAREPISAVQRCWLVLGRIPAPRETADTIVCHCAGVRRSGVVEAARLHGPDMSTIGRVTGAGLYCGGCIDRVAALTNAPNPWRWLTLTTGILVLLLAMIAAMVPAATAGASVRNYWFTVHSVLTGHAAQQASGWLAFGFIALALGVTAPARFPRCPRCPRGVWLHLLFGALALLFVPVHTLGGIGDGWGLNGVLVAVFFACIVFGALVWLARFVRVLAWLHTAVTVVLLVALALHVIDVYQY